jgi:dienelactone hydrolase
MQGSAKHVLVAILFAVLFLSTTYAALAVNSDFGRIDVRTIRVEDQGKQLSALLFRPVATSPGNPSPAIVLAHGISESKDMTSNLGLELARRGFVVLCLDLLGHGGSDGTVSEGNNETDFGVSVAVQYLEAQPYVNASEIGLVGHSLGGGAVIAVATIHRNISAVVLIAGGLGTSAQGQSEKLNSTFPRNLLVIVGKYDVLFNETELETAQLPPVFNTSTPVTPGRVYGDFESQTARKLVVPSTTHLFETIDPQVVSESVAWMEKALKQNTAQESNIGFSYPERELALLFALIGLLGTTLLIHNLTTTCYVERQGVSTTENKCKVTRKAHATWAMLNLLTFFPLVLVGFVISFPPLIFGSSIAWWVLTAGLIGTFLLAENKPKIFETKPHLKTALSRNFRNGAVTAIILFALFFTVSSLLHVFFAIDLRILAPIFQEFTQLRRVMAFAAFIPFFLVYFIAEAFYLHGPISQSVANTGKLAKIGELAKIVFVKISPFILIIGLQYLSRLILGVWLLPGFAGFITEFLWLIVPLFVITTTCSWWFHNKTGTLATGVVFNTLLLAWVAAVIFPF